MEKSPHINHGNTQTDVVPDNLKNIVTWVNEYYTHAPIGKLIQSYEFAYQAHQKEWRLSGDPYIQHCIAVTEILAQLRMDMSTLCAGLLHDVLEDTSTSWGALESKFGSEIANLVDGVTKISKKKFEDREEREVENMRKIILAMAQDIRVIIIKLADRLHNMRTLQFHTREKQIRIALDTQEIYAPIAHRLGIGKIKMELEDLSLRYLNPDMYEQLQVYVAKKRVEREEYTEQIKKVLLEKLPDAKIPARIEGRAKHFYSIYQKIQLQKKSMDEIYDLTAIRVITESVRDCYAVLGIVHTLWKPIQNRFKDYIAMPKSNMYQSLHTTVWGPNKEPVEIQIRTQEMHRIAEDGIAAHWLYKEGKSKEKEQYEQRFGWLRQLLEWQQETHDPHEYMENLKIDLFSEEVFVFTPKGGVKELPIGGTSVDFAFAVHTEIGNHCIGAKVNGKLTPLRTPLNTGDIVEVITNKNAKPSRDWLTFVKTSRARNKITHFLNLVESEKYIQDGKDELTRELKLIHSNFQEATKSDLFLKICSDLGFPGPDEVYIAIGSGKISAKNIVNRLFPSRMRQVKQEDTISEPYTRSQEGVLIRGLNNVLIRFGKCCHPVSGDPILGFITRGRGISIHKKGCTSISPFLLDKERIINVTWDTNAMAKHLVPLKIIGQDRPGFLRDVLDQIASMNINVRYAKAQPLSSTKGQILVTLDIIDNRQLEELIKLLNKTPGVLEAGRTNRVK